MTIDVSFRARVARWEISPARWRRPLLRWLEGIEAGWAVPLLLLGFVAVWLAYRIFAFRYSDLHPDVLEAWISGRTFGWGGPKHPPLMGWVARAWTSIFPLTNWSFELMALTNSAMALWAIDLISRRFVRGDKRIVVLLLLMLTPIYQFYAMRFNANTVLLAVWPIATYCFLRSFETRQAGWAIAAGATAALAMLGKYYSAFLVCSFIFAAICHPQRRAYFGSAAPWLSALVGCVVLGPHLHWLATTGAMPFTYAFEHHAGKTFGSALVEATAFLLGLTLAMAMPAVAWLLIAGHRRKRFSDDFRAMSPGLLLLSLVGVGTIAFPVITSVWLGTDMLSLWAFQGLFLFVILVVCATGYPIERFHSVNLAILVIGIAASATAVAAPIQAIYRNIHPLSEGRNFYRLSAVELTRLWHRQTDTALSVVGGDEEAAFAAAFYSPDHPVYDERLVCQSCRNSQEMMRATFKRGWVALCFDGDSDCIDTIERNAAGAARIVRSEFVVHSMLLGWSGAVQRFTALIVPPAVEGDDKPSLIPHEEEEAVADRDSRSNID
jgi:4-amino-4-deoxy-L-arabinose transferase-like glycosyltransferase